MYKRPETNPQNPQNPRGWAETRTCVKKMTDNMHPADELHALRQQKSELDRRIKEVRALLLELPPQERLGSKYAAEVICQERTVFDKAAITKEMGQAWVDAHSTQTSSYRVGLVALPLSRGGRQGQ